MKRVFVTGAGHGIGRAIVEAFTSVGDCVAFCDIDTLRGKEVEQATGARFFALDVCNKAALEEAVQSLLAEWGDIDIIVNNVGIGGFESITETTVEHFETVLNTNLRSAFITSRLLAIHRKNSSVVNPYGRIVNLCSTRYLQSEAGTEAYAASKGGIWSLTHALAVSLGGKVRVNSISPGWIDTNFTVYEGADAVQQPVGRVGNPLDIANMVLFLCSEKAGFITGENICIDGGQTRLMIYHNDCGWSYKP
jgi:NAD(P)-dependent dehydrogenase (short-subunit alcohol dehydrogenase family)